MLFDGCEMFRFLEMSSSSRIDLFCLLRSCPMECIGCTHFFIRSIFSENRIYLLEEHIEAHKLKSLLDLFWKFGVVVTDLPSHTFYMNSNPFAFIRGHVQYAPNVCPVPTEAIAKRNVTKAARLPNIMSRHRRTHPTTHNYHSHDKRRQKKKDGDQAHSACSLQPSP